MLHNSISNQDQSIKLNNLNMYMSLQTNNNTQQIITNICAGQECTHSIQRNYTSYPHLPGHVNNVCRDFLDFVGGYIELCQRLHLADCRRKVGQIIVCQVQAAETVEPKTRQPSYRYCSGEYFHAGLNIHVQVSLLN